MPVLADGYRRFVEAEARERCPTYPDLAHAVADSTARLGVAGARRPA